MKERRGTVYERRRIVKIVRWKETRIKDSKRRNAENRKNKEKYKHILKERKEDMARKETPSTGITEKGKKE
jgi:hypothetical protein